MIHKPSQEQLDIFDCMQNETCNMVVNALAGSGKTTVLVEGLKYLPENKSKIFLAMNKHIVAELKHRIVDKSVRIGTSHSIGLAAIRAVVKDLEIDDSKAYKVLIKRINSWHMGNMSADEKKIYFKDMLKMINLTRLTLTFDVKYIVELAVRHDILFSVTDAKRVLIIIEEMLNNRKQFDYVDMVYLPCIDNKYFIPKYDIVLCDEIQDMNRSQQMIIKKLSKKEGGRTIAVGDNFQTLYGFAGSDSNSFNRFLNLPNTKILPLTTTYRCAKKIVRYANELVPNLKAAENAADGIVRDGDVLNESKSGDFILCRTIKPLIKLFYELLALDKKATIKGKDIGISLIDLIKPYGENCGLGSLNTQLNKKLWEFDNNLRESGVLDTKDHVGYNTLADKIEAISIISDGLKNIGQLSKRIETLFTDDIEGIVLSTVHKAKGLEAPRVFIIRPDKLPMKVSQAWAWQQEKNLQYVAITRAINELIVDFIWSDEPDIVNHVEVVKNINIFNNKFS